MASRTQIRAQPQGVQNVDDKYYASDISYNDGMLKLKGMTNLGNTCYMGAALQALLCSNIMNSRILRYTMENSAKNVEMTPMLYEYTKLIYTLAFRADEPKTITSADALVPRDFKTVLSKSNKTFDGFSQQDAHELITFLLDDFTEIAKELRPVEKRDPKVKQIYTGIRKLLRDTYFGTYRQVVHCNECSNNTIRVFDHVDIILPVPRDMLQSSVRTRYSDHNHNSHNGHSHGHIQAQAQPQRLITIEHCFTKYCAVETFEDKNKIDCSKCKVRTNSSKKMELEYVPELVILTINRFEGTNKLAIPIKLYTKIELDGYPLRLISTVNHAGSTIHGGHYTSYVSRYYYDDDGVCQEKWFMADDAHVREVDRSVVLQDPRVYLALYERVPRKQQ